MHPVKTQKTVLAVLWLLTLFTLSILFFIIWYILKNGLPQINFEFLFSYPKQMGKAGGILPTIISTIYLIAVAIIVAAPLGIGTAIYLVEYAKETIATKIIRFSADCLAGVPSIIFGLFGFVFFVIYLQFGWSILSGGLTLACMILPTIIRTSEEAIKSVPQAYREISLALGATKWQTVVRSVLPSALPGILTGIILSIGRSIGETACVIYTAGSSLKIPKSIFDSGRTMSVHFYILAREGISMEKAYGTAVVLIITILIINVLAYWLMQKFIKKFVQ